VSEKDFVGRTKDGEVLLSVGDSEIVVTELCIAKEGCLQKREQVGSEGFFRDFAQCDFSRCGGMQLGAIRKVY